MSRARGRSSTTTRGRSASSSRGAKHKIAGQEMSWEYDPDTELSTQPDETFPVRPWVFTGSKTAK